MFIDPVCGMEIKDDTYSLLRKGRLYHFCSEGCMKRFKKSKGKYIKRKDYDLIIIGGGPAGLTAAVYASMQHLDTFLITKDIGGQAIDSTKVKNYMGFDFITGPELTSKFQNQFLHTHFIDHRIGEVIAIEKKENRFLLRTRNGENYIALSIILTTGMQRKKLGVPGEERLQRQGIFYNRVQDTGLLEDIPVAVIGGGNTGVQAALDLFKVASKVTLITFEDLTADAHLKKDIQRSPIQVFTQYAVVSIEGEDRVKGVVIRPRSGGKTISIEVGAVFVGIGLMPNTSLVSKLLKRNKLGEVVISKDCWTSVPGIFAAGDVTDVHDKRIVIASGEGAKAALAAHRYLKELKRSNSNFNKGKLEDVDYE
ncbi:MAG: FAD-dependent oxidoreductase [bacterium]